MQLPRFHFRFFDRLNAKEREASDQEEGYLGDGRWLQFSDPRRHNRSSASKQVANSKSRGDEMVREEEHVAKVGQVEDLADAEFGSEDEGEEQVLVACLRDQKE